MRSTNTGKKPSAFLSASSRKQKPATCFEPRPLTPSEIDWLKREGREFQDQYEGIRAALTSGHEDRSQP